MKTITIKENSRAYRFAKGWGKWRHWEPEKRDICSFRRALIWGAFKVLLLVSILLAIYVAVTFALYMAFLRDGYGHPLLYAILALPLGVLALGAAGVGVGFALTYMGKGIDLYRKARREAKRLAPAKPPTALQEAYTSWKEKYCAKVSIER